MPVHKPLQSTPEEIEQAFYEALESGDLDALMDLWADDEQVVCIHPGGPRVEGYHDVRESWREILNAGALQIRAVPLHAMVGGVLAVHNVIEQVLMSGSSGQTQVIQVHATNVFHNGPAGWKLVMHHASPAIDSEEAEEIDEFSADSAEFDAPPTLH